MLELARLGGKIHTQAPAWAASLFDLGVVARSGAVLGRKRVFGVLAPTRTFGAVFVGLGAVLSHPPATSPETQSWKRDLEPGTECWYPVQSKFVRCRVTNKASAHQQSIHLETLATIPSERGRIGIKVPQHMLSRLLPVDEENDGKALKMQVKGRGLLERLFGTEESYAFYGERHLDVLICGVADDLLEESRFMNVLFENEQAAALQLLRPRSIFGAKSGFRSDIVTSLQRPRVVGQEPQVVVFDGAYAYLQWGRIWKNSTIVVLLDESSPSRARLGEAISRLCSIRDRGTPIPFKPIPDSTFEWMAVEL